MSTTLFLSEKFRKFKETKEELEETKGVYTEDTVQLYHREQLKGVRTTIVRYIYNITVGAKSKQVLPNLPDVRGPYLVEGGAAYVYIGYKEAYSEFRLGNCRGKKFSKTTYE